MVVRQYDFPELPLQGAVGLILGSGNQIPASYVMLPKKRKRNQKELKYM